MTHFLRKFVDPLPTLDKITPRKKDNDSDSAYLEIEMSEFYQKLHHDLRPTRLWGYNRRFPGPLIEVPRGQRLRVKWKNKLPARHFLPIDDSFMEDMPEVRTVVHLHGSETKPDSDGYPDAWFTRDFNEVGPDFLREVYEYPNHQRGTTLWYHDHAMGITRLNVYAGLVGMYIIRDKEEKKLNLPSGDYEIPLIILDRSFNRDGSLFYPNQPDDAGEGLPNPSVVPFFQGDTILVNGKVWPYLEVEPRKYRFRVVNASNARSYQLHLDSGEMFYQIGSDGGLLQKTVPLNQLFMQPADRADIVIDFSNYSGQTVTLKNNLGPNPDEGDRTDDVMQFKVSKPLTKPDTSSIPEILSKIKPLTATPIRGIRNLKLVGQTDEYGRPLLLLNSRMWHDPITETPRLGDTEVWSLMNLTAFPHPIHIHLVQFQILDRRPFNVDLYNQTGELEYTGPAVLPAENERGWKDTVSASPGQITRVIMRFAPYTGNYVYHCHILEHEDYEMMRPFTVVPDEK